MDAEDLQKLARQNELNDLRQVMSTKAGRRFIWRQLERGGAFGKSYARDAKDVHTFYLLGRREFTLKLYNDVLEADQLAFWNMQAENIGDAEQGPELQRFLKLLNQVRDNDA